MAQSSRHPRSPKGIMPELVPVEPDLRLEAALIEKLDRGEGDLVKVALELAQLCSRAGRPRAAVPYLERLADALPDPETSADLLLKCGQLMEQANDFDSAKTHYERGLAAPITSAYIRYFLHNNLGFCLNELRCHAEAEAHCRNAIEIAPKQYNAYKNCAIALEHMSDWAGAAFNFVAAARLAPTDRRALMHLNGLLEAHPEVYDSVENLRDWHEEILSRDRKLCERYN
jgi:tetratricopeptide (TPR) repeat protein